MSKASAVTNFKNRTLKEKYISWAFVISLVVKGVDALVEMITGGILYFVASSYITNFALSITKGELLEDPTDFIANHLISSANQLSVDSQHFAALYLIVHGLIKVVLVVVLLRKKLWAYPVSIVVFGLFIVYEVYSFAFTGSLWLLVLALLDIVVVWLTVYEYRRMK